MGENKEQDTEETDEGGVGGEKTSRKERQWAGKMGKIEGLQTTDHRLRLQTTDNK